MTETLTVRDLCTSLSAIIAGTFPDEVWVKGAISSLSRSNNGHVYFDLVEPSDDLGASTSVVMPVALFASNRQRVNAILRKSGAMRMHDGLEIRIRGQVAYYPPQARVQLVMSLIDPAYTLGQMALARQALLDQLRADGLLHANRALQFPAVPLQIALVTSDRSAAHADFVHELNASPYAFEVELFDSRVQGLDAVPSLVDAIKAAAKSAAEVIVIIRGGGARTDLAAFDHEQVARTIAGCALPVVVGVGHETDHSVADEVAHTSAKTPTASAVLLVEATRRFENEVAGAAGRLAVLAGRRLDVASNDLTAGATRLLAATSLTLSRHTSLLDTFVTQLDHRSERALERSEAVLDRAAVRLDALDPVTAMARGWSITHSADGGLVGDVSKVAVGTTLITTTASGQLVSTVSEVRPDGDDAA